jgi:hypothetical protein
MHPGLSGGWVRNAERDFADDERPTMPRLDKLAGLLLAFGLNSLDQLLGPVPGPTAEAIEDEWGRNPPPHT